MQLCRAQIHIQVLGLPAHDLLGVSLEQASNIQACGAVSGCCQLRYLD